MERPKIYIQGEEQEYYTECYKDKYHFLTEKISIPSDYEGTIEEYPPEELRICRFFVQDKFSFSIKLPHCVIECCPRLRDSCLEEECVYEIYQHKEEKILYTKDDIQLLLSPLWHFTSVCQDKETILFEDVYKFCHNWQVLDTLSRLNFDDHAILSGCFQKFIEQMVQKNLNTFLSDDQRSKEFLNNWKKEWSSVVNYMANAGLLKYILRLLTCQGIALMHLESEDLTLLGETIRQDHLYHCLLFRYNKLIPWFIYQEMFGIDTRLENFNIAVWPSSDNYYFQKIIPFFTMWSKTTKLLEKMRIAFSANTNLVRFLCGYYLPVKQRFELCWLLGEMNVFFEIRWKENNVVSDTDTNPICIPELSISTSVLRYNTRYNVWTELEQLLNKSVVALFKLKNEEIKIILVENQHGRQQTDEFIWQEEIRPIILLFSRLPHVEIISTKTDCSFSKHELFGKMEESRQDVEISCRKNTRIGRRRRVCPQQEYTLPSDNSIRLSDIHRHQDSDGSELFTSDVSSDDDVSIHLSDIHRHQDSDGGELFTSSLSPSRPFETTSLSPCLSPTITNSPSFDAFLQSNNEKLALEALEEEKLRQKVYELIGRRRRVRSRQGYTRPSDIDISSDDDVSKCLSDIDHIQDNNGGESFTSSSSPSRPFETTFSSPRLSPIVTNSPSLSDCSESNRKQLALAREKFARQRKKVDKLFDQKW